MRAVCDLQRERPEGQDTTGRKSRGESIRLMFVNLNPKGRRLPTKLVSPARRWARGPPKPPNANSEGQVQCIANASDKRTARRL